MKVCCVCSRALLLLRDAHAYACQWYPVNIAAFPLRPGSLAATPVLPCVRLLCHMKSVVRRGVSVACLQSAPHRLCRRSRAHTVPVAERCSRGKYCRSMCHGCYYHTRAVCTLSRVSAVRAYLGSCGASDFKLHRILCSEAAFMHI